MKASKTPVASVTSSEPTSFKDAGYQSAVTGERETSIARWVLNKCPTFLDEVPKEVKAELEEGFALRWQEINPAKSYSKDWIPVETDGSFDATLAFCLSYSQQAFGQMKNEDPVKHGVIKQVRDAFSKYKSNRMSDLKAAVRRVTKEGQTSTRTQAKSFSTWLDDTFDTMKARCKTAVARNDEQANEVKLRVAIDAFKKAYHAE